MEAHVEEVGPCKRKITVQVPAKDVTGKFDENYENLRKSLELPGFRRGHVPRRLMERRFGDDVAKDVRRILLDETFEKAVGDNELEVVGRPDFQEEDLAEAIVDQPFSYTVTVEIKPEFDLPDYAQLALKKPSVEPTEKELQSRIEFYRHRMATLETIDDAATTEDMITADIDFRVADETIWKRENISLAVSHDDVAGVTIEKLSEELTGAKSGDAKTFKTTLPDTFHIEEHRGKEVKVAIEVKEVKRPVLPEPTDEWAADMGFDSLDELKDELNNQITRTKESDARQKMRTQIRDQLAEAVLMDLPEDLMKRVAEDNDRRRRMYMEYEGVSEEEIEKKMTEEVEKTAEDAVKNVKLYFIFDAIAEEETILVTEDELHARVDQLAANYSVEAERFREMMESEGQLDSVRRDMLDEKIIDFLISKANVEEAAPTEEQEAPQEPAKATEEGKTEEQEA